MYNPNMMQGMFGQSGGGQSPLPWRTNPSAQTPSWATQGQALGGQGMPPAPMMPQGMAMPPRPPQQPGMQAPTVGTNPVTPYSSIPTSNTPSTMMQGANPGTPMNSMITPPNMGR
jgi:hypothetical protein